MVNLSKLIEHTAFYSYDIEYYILVVLIGLHYNKIIDDNKLKGQLKSLRDGTLNKRKNNYHCKINNKWYNDESPRYIFDDLSQLIPQTNISFNEFIKYIQLYENKNYNYCLNIIFRVYLKEIYDKWNPEYNYSFKDINPFKLKDFPNIVAIHKNYEYCEYCGHIHTAVEKNINDINNINNYIHHMKKGNLSKIPFFDISSNIINN